MESQQTTMTRDINFIKIKSSKKIEDHEENYINFIIAMCDAIYSSLCEEKLPIKKDHDVKE